MKIVKHYYVLLTLAVIFIAHLSFIPNGFVWLDHGDIEQQRATVPITSIDKMVTSGFGNTRFYRPMATLVTSIDNSLYGTWAPGFHFTNVFLHLLVVIVSLPFLSLFFSLKPIEKVLAILFIGLAPINVLPVGAISYRPELLLTLFTMLTLVSHAHHHKIRAGIFFLCALFSKETALVLVPLLLIVWEAMVNKKRDVRSLLAYVPILVVYAALRTYAVPDVWQTPARAISPSLALGTRLSALGILLSQILSPVFPRLSDATPIVSWTHPESLVILIGICISIVLYLRYKAARLPILLLAISLLPSLNIVPLPRFTSPHYGYFATIFVGAYLVFLFRFFNKSMVLIRYAGIALILLWLTMAGYTTVTAGSRFSNDRALFEPEIARDPNFREGLLYVGDYWFRQRDFGRAEQAYLAALVENNEVIAFVDRGAVMNNLAGAYVAEKRFDDALATLEKAAVDPKIAGSAYSETILYNRTVILYEQKRFSEVINLLESKKPITNPKLFAIQKASQEQLEKK